MKVTVNGEPRELDSSPTVAELITTLAGSVRGTAIVVDGTVVPRSAWSREHIPDGAVIELITAVQGG